MSDEKISFDYLEAFNNCLTSVGQIATPITEAKRPMFYRGKLLYQFRLLTGKLDTVDCFYIADCPKGFIVGDIVIIFARRINCQITSKETGRKTKFLLNLVEKMIKLNHQETLYQSYLSKIRAIDTDLIQ